jgi:hypothetical protein
VRELIVEIRLDPELAESMTDEEAGEIGRLIQHQAHARSGEFTWLAEDKDVMTVRYDHGRR